MGVGGAGINVLHFASARPSGKAYAPGTVAPAMRRLAVALPLLLLAGCAGGPPPGGDEDVGMTEAPRMGFVPVEVQAKAGEPVRWRNTGGAVHTVTAADGSFDSGAMRPGATFRHTFAAPGTYDYYCQPHSSRASNGTWVGMVGRVVVA